MTSFQNSFNKTSIEDFLPGFVKLNALIILTIIVVFSTGCEKPPPTPGLVATYEGGTITSQELRKELHKVMPRCEEDYMCSTHGSQHELCVDTEKCEKYDSHHDLFEKPRVYNKLIQDMVIDEMAKKIAKEKKIDKDDAFKHAMKHIDEQINLTGLQSKLYEKEIRVSDIEIQKYFDQNSLEFEGKTLSESRKDIERKLKSMAEDEYISGYIKELEAKASVTRNYSLLMTPLLQDGEILNYYRDNIVKFYKPESVEIKQIKIATSNNEKQDLLMANKALQLLRSGEDWNKVYKEYSEKGLKEGSLSPIRIEKGLKSKEFDESVFTLNQGELSDVLRDENGYLIVRLINKNPGRQKEFSEVEEQIRNELQQKNEIKFYQENRNNTLFTIHGEPYTLGIFLEELDELSPEYKVKYNTAEGKKELLNRLIQRMVLVEAAQDEVDNPQNVKLGEKNKTAVLRQMLHQEEVDENIQINEQDIKNFFQKNRLNYRFPARAKINYIRIDKGDDSESQKKSAEKIREAFIKLNPGLGKKAADFAAVAKEYSQDPNAEQGGSLDRWFSDDENSEEYYEYQPIYDIIFSLPQGGISKPLEYRFSWWIFNISQREESRLLEFDEVKDYIKEELMRKKHEQLTVEKDKALIKGANLVIYNSVVKNILKTEKEISILEQKERSILSTKKE